MKTSSITELSLQLPNYVRDCHWGPDVVPSLLTAVLQGNSATPGGTPINIRGYKSLHFWQYLLKWTHTAQVYFRRLERVRYRDKVISAQCEMLSILIYYNPIIFKTKCMLSTGLSTDLNRYSPDDPSFSNHSIFMTSFDQRTIQFRICGCKPGSFQVLLTVLYN